jgi:cell division protein FtsI/penicillin-binding protein 2
MMFFILFVRLFFVQIVNYRKYDDVLSNQHVTQSSLESDRGNIYAYDKANNEVKLTENISMYNVFVDPKFI